MRNSKNKMGFLLLSFLVYLLLFTLLVTLCFDWTLTLFTTYTTRAKRNMVIINAYTAQDLFIRDLHMAPLDEQEWKKVTASEIIWSTHNRDIGWCYKNKKLIRNEGHYNKQMQKWNKKTASIAAQHINTLTFTVNKQLFAGKSLIKNVTIECRVAQQGCPYTLIETIALKNRVVI
ncbi:MAG TPA: hypothetical protein ENI08_02795 [Candidatus Dependentiae bacterium]|nr:hypothetical protein [Candidatus Dependentiae bacterium]